MIRFGQNQNLASSKAFDLFTAMSKYRQTSNALMARQSSLQQFKTNASITQNETNIPSLHCLCIMRYKLLQRSWFDETLVYTGYLAIKI